MAVDLLWQEHLFRDLYDHVRGLEDDAIDFSMDTRSFRMNWTWKGTVLSPTLRVFYGVLVLTIFLAMFGVCRQGAENNGTQSLFQL